MVLGKSYYFIWHALFRIVSGCFGSWFGVVCVFVLFFFNLWPWLFTSTENTARTGLGDFVLRQCFLFMAISNYFSKSNRAGPELESISSEFAVLQASL